MTAKEVAARYVGCPAPESVVLIREMRDPREAGYSK